jgi:WD40 repeat protein
VGNVEASDNTIEFSSAVLGLSWLNKGHSKFLAGTAAGSVHMYDVEWMNSGRRGGCVQACDDVRQLTSLHVNSEDDRFVVSGYTPHVGLFDLATGLRVEDMRDCHAEPINVIKFAHHSPHTLVTSSFDRYIKKWDLREARPGGIRRPIFERRSNEGNIMVCFSPDDQYLLVSAVDNEVRQYSAGDGKLNRLFDIPKTHSRGNYTRSYYMNGRDYVITGSCREDVVRVYNSRTGQLLREIELDSDHSAMVFVQSLRANPHRDFNLSVLLACNERATREPSLANLQTLANVDLLDRMSTDACFC